MDENMGSTSSQDPAVEEVQRNSDDGVEPNWDVLETLVPEDELRDFLNS